MENVNLYQELKLHLVFDLRVGLNRKMVKDRYGKSVI